jgi:hypothetical protein
MFCYLKDSGFETNVTSFLFHFGQIIEKDPLQPSGPPEMSLVEIGPRFVLTPIRIFEGAFGGATVFANPGTLTCLTHVLCYI